MRRKSVILVAIAVLGVTASVATQAERPILFNELPAYPTGPYARPSNMVVADFTGDQVLDVICDGSMLSWAAPPFYQWSFLEGVAPTSTDKRLFRDYVNYEADSGPQSLLAADFNGDGLLDVAGCGVGYTIITILFNTGAPSAQFSAPYQFGVPTGGYVLRAFIAIDFTGDAIPDIVAVDDNGRVWALRGVFDAGQYTLQQAQTVIVPGWGMELGTSDINFDGHDDVLVFSNDSHQGYVSILLTTGSDTTPLSSPTTSSAVCEVAIQSAVGDLNGDGLSDFAVADLSSPSLVQVYTANGSTDAFPFTPAREWTCEHSIYALRIADLNNDGNGDVLTFGTEWCHIYMGQNTVDPVDVAFVEAETLTLHGQCSTPAIVDLNEDGSLDILTNLFRSNAVATILGVPSAPGTFTSSPRQATVCFPERVFATDFDRDGRPDIVVAGTGYDGHMPGENYGLSVYRHAGRTIGDNPYEETYQVRDARPRAVEDFNNDGIPDVLDLYLDCYLGNGSDGIGDGTYTKISGGFGRIAGSVVVSDVNNDGVLDVVKTYRVNGSVGVVVGIFYGESVGGSGTGRFVAGPWYEMGWDRFSTPLICDINDDGLDDVFVYVQNGDEDNIGRMGFLINDVASPGTYSRCEFWTMPFVVGAMIVSEGSEPGKHDVWLSHMRYGQAVTPKDGSAMVGDWEWPANAGKEAYAENGRLTIWKDFSLVDVGGYAMSSVEERDYPAPFLDFGLADLDNDNVNEFCLFCGVECVEQLQGTTPTWSGYFIGSGAGRTNAFADVDGDGDLDIIGGNSYNPFGAYLNFWRNDTEHGSTPVFVGHAFAQRQAGGARISWQIGGAWASTALEVWRGASGLSRELVGIMSLSAPGEGAIIDAAPPAGETEYWLRVVGDGGAEEEWYGPTILAASVPQLLLAPSVVPNPFNPRTEIRFNLPRMTRATLSIYDQRGRLVRRLVDGLLAAGEQSAEWDGCDGRGSPAAAGAYVVSLVTEQGMRASKITLVK